MCFGKTAHNPATHITVTVPSDKCLVCQSGATSRPPRRENRACGGSDSSSNVFCRHFRRIKSCVYCRGQAGPPIGSNKSAQPRITFGNYQGNVTDALRRSEAELACSEIGIVTTRTSKGVLIFERRHRDRGDWDRHRATPRVQASGSKREVSCIRRISYLLRCARMARS